MCSKQSNNIYYLQEGGTPIIKTARQGLNLTEEDEPIIASDSPGGRMLKIATDLIEGTIKGAVGAAEGSFTAALEGVTGDMPEKPWTEVAPKLMHSIEKNKEFAENFIQDEKMQEAVKELVETYAEAIAKVHDISKPAIDELVGDFWETIDEVGKRSAIGVMNTGMNVAEAAAGEIPVVGGLMDLALAAARGFNHFSKAVAPWLEKGPAMIQTASESAARGKEVADTYVPRIANKLNRIHELSEAANSKNPKMALAKIAAKNPLETIKTAKTMSNLSRAKNPQDIGKALGVPDIKTLTKKGGKARKTRRKRAKKTINRLKKSIDRFTRKRG
uniref:Uncharacterized protein n=1 Tax=viral metagenome TaxID=1070528 RepID=A0A6C0CNQ4_9ZZZZ